MIKYLTPPSTLFRSDTRGVESTTGWYIILISFWIWLAQWFGGFLPALVHLHGWEWLAAIVGMSYGYFHVIYPHVLSRKARAKQAYITAGVMIFLGMTIFFNIGWRPGGSPAFMLTAIVYIWVYLELSRGGASGLTDGS